MLLMVMDFDVRFIGGLVVFGIGWGLSGFCLGGLVLVFGIGMSEFFIIVVVIVVGMIMVCWLIMVWFFGKLV